MSDTIHLTPFQLEQLLTTAVEIGVSRVTEKKAYVFQAEAYKKYGRRTIDRWVQEMKITPVKQNTRVKFDAHRLNELSKVNELYDKFLTK